jgi:HKD family nuclease
MQLVTNDGAGHRAAIRDVFKSANEALIAVAFLKKGGATFLCGELRARLKAGARARVFIGTDFYLTEPDALQTLLDLADEYDRLEVFFGRTQRGHLSPENLCRLRPA